MATHRRGTPLWAGIQSALVPGWGQVSTGHPVVGWTLVAVSLAIGAFAAAWVVTVGPTEVLARLADPTILLAILALNVFMAGLRLSVAAHAWWAGGGRRVLARLVRGPSLADRAAALDLLSVLGISLLALLALKHGQPAFLDIAILLGLVGFLSSVAFARSMEAGPDRPDEEDPE